MRISLKFHMVESIKWKETPLHYLTRGQAPVIYATRLSYANALFDGRALEWIDEEAAIYAIC